MGFNWVFFFSCVALWLALAPVHCGKRLPDLNFSRSMPVSEPAEIPRRRLQPKFAKPVPVAGTQGKLKRAAHQRTSTAKTTASQNKQTNHIVKHDAKKADQKQKIGVKTRRYGNSLTSNGKGGKTAGGKPIAPTSRAQQLANAKQVSRNNRKGDFGTGSTRQAPTPKNLSGGRSSRSPSMGQSSQGAGGGGTRPATRRPQSHSPKNRGVTGPTNTFKAPKNIGKNFKSRRKNFRPTPEPTTPLGRHRFRRPPTTKRPTPVPTVGRRGIIGSGRRNGKGHSRSFTPVRPGRPTRSPFRSAAGGTSGVGGSSLAPIARSSGHRPAKPSWIRAAAPNLRGGGGSTSSAQPSRRARRSSNRPSTLDASNSSIGTAPMAMGKKPRRGPTHAPARSNGNSTAPSKPITAPARKPTTQGPTFAYGRRGKGTSRPTPRPTYNPAFPRPTFNPTFFNPLPPKGFIPRTSWPTAHPTRTPRPTLHPTTLRQGIQKDNSGQGGRNKAAGTVGYGNYSNPANLLLPPANALMPPTMARTTTITSTCLPNPQRKMPINYKALVKRYKLSPDQVLFFYMFLRTKWAAGNIHLTTGVQQIRIQMFNGLRNVSQTLDEQRLQNGYWIDAIMTQIVNDPAAFNELASKAVRNIIWAGLARTNDPTMVQAAGQQMAGVNMGITGGLSILDGRINCGQISFRQDVNQRICRRLSTGKAAEEEGKALTSENVNERAVHMQKPLAADEDVNGEEEGGEEDGLDSLQELLQLPPQALEALFQGIEANIEKDNSNPLVGVGEVEAMMGTQRESERSLAAAAGVMRRLGARAGEVERSLAFPFGVDAPTPRPTNSWEEAKPTARPTPTPTLINQNTDITQLASLTFYLTVTYCVECIGAATNGRISANARIGRIVSAALQDRVIVEEAFQEAARTSSDIIINGQLSEVDVQQSTAAQPVYYFPTISGLRNAFSPTPRPTWTPPTKMGPSFAPSFSGWSQIGFPPTPLPTAQPSPVPGHPTFAPTPRPSRPSPAPTRIPTPAPTPRPTTSAPTMHPTRRPIAIWVAPSLPTARPTRTFDTLQPTARVNVNSNAGSTSAMSSSTMTTIIVVSCLLPIISILIYLGYRSFGSGSAEETRKKKWALQNMLKVIEEEDDDEVAIKRNSIHEFYTQKAAASSPAYNSTVGKIAAVSTRPSAVPRQKETHAAANSSVSSPPAAGTKTYKFDISSVEEKKEEEEDQRFSPYIINLRKDRVSVLARRGSSGTTRDGSLVRPGYSMRSMARNRDPHFDLPASGYNQESDF